MARRKKKNSSGTLALLAGILSVVLAVLSAVLILTKQETPAATEPSETAAPVTYPATEPTTEPTQPSAEPAPADQWIEKDGKHYYQYGDGTYATGWQEVEGELYYFREDCSMARGQVDIEGKRYFFTSAGRQIDLVNPWCSIPQDYQVELIKLSDELWEYSTRHVAKECYGPLLEMIADCNAAMAEKFAGTGQTPTVKVRSAYRSNDDQQVLFENKVTRVLNENPGMTREEAEALAATMVAIPGTSEHQLGLAVDLVDSRYTTLNEAQEDMDVQIWLMENSWRYGWILRYPNGTTDSTGIIYEPWHYRYVGKDVAEELYTSGLTLEEYIESLS